MKGSINNFLLKAFFIGLAILFVACEEEPVPTTRFTVKKGEHFSTPRLVQTLQSNVLHFQARFNESAMYDFEQDGFQDSKNKLLGFADCNSLHHQNSARFAWQWYNNRLEIWAYCYVNSFRTEKFVGIVHPGENNEYKITLTSNAYIFQLNEEPAIEIDRLNDCNKGVYYLLWPYFGGTLPAPHEVTVDINIRY